MLEPFIIGAKWAFNNTCVHTDQAEKNGIEKNPVLLHEYATGIIVFDTSLSLRNRVCL